MTVYAGPQIITQGLQIHLESASTRSYPGSGSSWLNLAENKAFSATAYGSPTYTQGQPSYFQLNGTDQYWLCANFTNLTLANWPVSVEVVFYSGTVYNNDFVYLAGMRSSSDNYLPIGLGIEARNSWVGNYSGAYGVTGISNYPRYTASSPGSIVDNTWYHVVQTATGSDTKLYLNGTLVSTSSSSQTFYTSATTQLGIGCAGMTGSTLEYPTYTSNQRISMVKIYNIELSATQVATNFQSVRTRYSI